MKSPSLNKIFASHPLTAWLPTNAACVRSCSLATYWPTILIFLDCTHFFFSAALLHITMKMNKMYNVLLTLQPYTHSSSVFPTNSFSLLAFLQTNSTDPLQCSLHSLLVVKSCQQLCHNCYCLLQLRLFLLMPQTLFLFASLQTGPSNGTKMLSLQPAERLRRVRSHIGGQQVNVTKQN